MPFRRRRRPLRVRLFWQLLLMFGLLIGFGIGGTTGLISVAFRQITSRNLPSTAATLQELWAEGLGDYYAAHGSWAGADERLASWVAVQSSLASGTLSYQLLDARSQVIIATDDAPLGEFIVAPPVAPDAPDTPLAQIVRPASAAPIVVNGQLVGTLQVAASGLFSPPPAFSHRLRDGRVFTYTPPTPVEQQLRRSFWMVAWSIGSVAFGLSVLMSRRISRPLRRMTQAAQQVAGGELKVSVPGSSIREVDQLASAFNHMTTDLAHADQLRRNMTADIAHELRTPLTIIRGQLEGILDGVYPATAEYVAPVLEEASLLERLIEDLRTLSLAEADKLPLHYDDVPPAELLGNVARGFAAPAAEHAVLLKVDADTALPVVRVDPQRMQQVLGNLVSNSLRYTPAGGAITLAAALSDGAVELTVADTGSGIAPDELPHIFDRFWRSDRARQRHGSAGLGLAIARQLVETQGGSIVAASELGHGTTITLRFPVAPPAEF